VQTKISIRHGAISDETRLAIAAKVEKLTRYFDRLTAIEITIDLERREQPQVDLKVSAEHKNDFVATVRAEDLMASMDQAIHKLEQQLRKYKEKIQERHRGSAGRQAGGTKTPKPASG
jgi:putative sigma-54 modulation protein